ncbi:MAG: anaerobic ribonucleoside-triphosphate reductase [Paludibacteraceae bacterium]|nr:anaerobic ribonucleoside-triphosphate reductase [Paludibacteraceae bacterium]
MANTVTKRDGHIVSFNKEKISKAILKAMKYGGGTEKTKIANDIANEIEAELISVDNVSISDIEALVYNKLISKKQRLTAKAYEDYRAVREYQRQHNTIDNKVLGIIDGTNKASLSENSNKNEALISTCRDLVAEEVSKDISLRMMLPPHIAQAHQEGIIHIHDLGHYLNHSFNCCLVNIEDMLQNGTVINGKMIEKPHSFRTACTIATQIIAQVASAQFGGQTITLSHLAPFVRISEERIREEVNSECDLFENFDENPDYKNIVEKIVQKRLAKEVRDGVQTFQYQINTLQTSNGQSPFLSVFMYIAENPEYEKETAMIVEEFIRQRIKGMKNEVGVWITPAFPKLLYVLDENNVHEDSEYWYITKLAAECVAKRMMPDFISAKHMKQNYEGNVFGCMGCRAWLSPYKGDINNEEGVYKWYGRFNMGLTSINLADCGMSAQGNIDEFWQIFDERLELCYESLILRYEKLKNVTSDASPIHWQHGAIARLPKHTPIYPLLQDGYATITLGYIGVYECVKSLLGVSHTTSEGEKLALEIVSYMKKKVLDWKKRTGLGFALYGTPSESLTEKFAQATVRRWGTVDGESNRNFLTNSYHVFVEEKINAFDKLKFESQFHPISSGGCISYIEAVNLSNNIPAVLSLIQYIYDNIQYAEINTKSDYCHVCGYDGEIMIDDNLDWYCPNCGNRDKSKMNVVRRTCGYLGENFWNKGRTEEIKNRYVHLGAGD